MSKVISEPAVLSIQLLAERSGSDYRVEHVELQGATMRHRIQTSTLDRTIDSLFAPRFADHVFWLLGKISAPMEVFTDTGLCFQLRDLQLRNVQIVSTIKLNGMRSVVIRFLDVVGNVQTILSASMTPTQAETNAIAVEAIERVVSRAYDMTYIHEHIPGLSEPTRAFEGCKRDIISKRDELLFRLDLLRRAVEAKSIAEPPAMEAPRVHAH